MKPDEEVRLLRDLKALINGDALRHIIVTHHDPAEFGKFVVSAMTRLDALLAQPKAEPNKWRDCKDCPYRVGIAGDISQISQKDCVFPECVGGWRAYAECLEEQLMTIPAQSNVAIPIGKTVEQSSADQPVGTWNPLEKDQGKHLLQNPELVRQLEAPELFVPELDSKP